MFYYSYVVVIVIQQSINITKLKFNIDRGNGGAGHFFTGITNPSDDFASATYRTLIFDCSHFRFIAPCIV